MTLINLSLAEEVLDAARKDGVNFIEMERETFAAFLELAFVAAAVSDDLGEPHPKDRKIYGRFWNAVERFDFSDADIPDEDFFGQASEVVRVDSNGKRTGHSRFYRHGKTK